MEKRYIHTLGCSTSPMLCGLALNSLCGVMDSVPSLKTFHNNLDVDLPAKAEPLPVKSEILWGWYKPIFLFIFWWQFISALKDGVCLPK